MISYSNLDPRSSPWIFFYCRCSSLYFFQVSFQNCHRYNCLSSGFSSKPLFFLSISVMETAISWIDFIGSPHLNASWSRIRSISSPGLRHRCQSMVILSTAVMKSRKHPHGEGLPFGFTEPYYPQWVANSQTPNNFLATLCKSPL